MSLKLALANGGFLLLAAGILGAFFFAAYLFNPVKEVEEHVVEPAARGIGLSPDLGCHDGWEGDQVADDAEEHVQSSCTRNDWIVYLTSEGKFWRALPPPGISVQVGPDGFVIDPQAVPGW